jgi:hypothetical protein
MIMPYSDFLAPLAATRPSVELNRIVNRGHCHVSRRYRSRTPVPQALAEFTERLAPLPIRGSRGVLTQLFSARPPDAVA